MTSSDRRDEIRNIISNERVTSVADLMERFGVCKNTILHDLDVITPTTSFITVSGRGGGIFATPGWYANEPHLNREQDAFLRRIMERLENPNDIKMMESILFAVGLPADKRAKTSMKTN